MLIALVLEFGFGFGGLGGCFAGVACCCLVVELAFGIRIWLRVPGGLGALLMLWLCSSISLFCLGGFRCLVAGVLCG